MARIAGINVSDNKHTVIALQSIYGIGETRAKDICKISNIAPSIKIKELKQNNFLYFDILPSKWFIIIFLKYKLAKT